MRPARRPLSSLPPNRCTLKEALGILGISKPTFYRAYRPPIVADRLRPADDATLREHYVRLFDIREVMIRGTETLTLERDHVIVFAAAERAAKHGELATGLSRRRLRFGKCAEPGFGSRVMKDGSPRRAGGHAEPLQLHHLSDQNAA